MAFDANDDTGSSHHVSPVAEVEALAGNDCGLLRADFSSPELRDTAVTQQCNQLKYILWPL